MRTSGVPVDVCCIRPYTTPPWMCSHTTACGLPPPPSQVIDPHTHEYMARLRDEPVFLALAQKVHEYFGRIGDTRK